MDVWALGVENRGVRSVIAPNGGDRLNCEQCGMCIDICPVGALTSGSYRYKTRPWEMNHVSTVCAHCADGCKVTLGVRQTAEGSKVVRADNRDKSGINGDFLCAKGRFGFDFVASAERLTQPLVRNAEGKLEPATWEHALHFAANKLKEIRDSRGGESIGVIGSNRTTNEENYLLQKFARTILRTNNIDHERTTDYAAFARALAGHKDKAASLRDIASAPAILLVGGNPTEEHPLLAWLLRTNVRLNHARLYVANAKPIKLKRQSTVTQELPMSGYTSLAAFLEKNQAAFSQSVRAEETLVVIFGQEYRGPSVESLVAWGLQRGNVRFAFLGDYANSRGAADMGLFPDLLPGYVPVAAPGAFSEYPGLSATPGKSLPEIFEAASKDELGALLVVGANPVAKLTVNPATLKNTFVVVQDLFLTETAALADVVLPAASLYEKSGTVTNTYGDVQLVRKAVDRAGVKPDLEIFIRLADAMGADIHALVPFGKGGVTADLGQSRGAQAGEADRHAVWLATNNMNLKTSPFDPLAVLDEIERLVPGYRLDRSNLLLGNDVRTEPGFEPLSELVRPDLVFPAHDGLFTSGTLGRYSTGLRELKQHQASVSDGSKQLAREAEEL
jgi:NADH-quinone oxidoreductase subunit G